MHYAYKALNDEKNMCCDHLHFETSLYAAHVLDAHSTGDIRLVTTSAAAYYCSSKLVVCNLGVLLGFIKHGINIFITKIHMSTTQMIGAR